MIFYLIIELYGSLTQDIGAGKGKYYAVNFPLRDGIDDESYGSIFEPVGGVSYTALLVLFRPLFVMT